MVRVFAYLVIALVHVPLTSTGTLIFLEVCHVLWMNMFIGAPVGVWPAAFGPIQVQRNFDCLPIAVLIMRCDIREMQKLEALG